MQITDIQFEKVSFSFEQPMKVAFAEIKDIGTSKWTLVLEIF